MSIVAPDSLPSVNSLRSLSIAAGLRAMLLSAFVLVWLAGSSLPAMQQDAAASRPQSPIYAVVDVERAIAQYPVFLKMRSRLDDKRKMWAEREQQMLAELNEKRSTIEVLPEADRERDEREFQLKIDVQRAERQRDMWQAEWQLEHLRMNLTVFEDVDYAVAKVAKQKGIALVLRRRAYAPTEAPIEDLPLRAIDRLVNDYANRVVMFADDSLDITADVIKEMMVPLPARNSAERLQMLGIEPKPVDAARAGAGVKAGAGSGAAGSGGE